MAESAIKRVNHSGGVRLSTKPLNEFPHQGIWAEIKLPNDRSKSPIVRFGFNGTLIGEPLTRAHLIMYSESLLRVGEQASKISRSLKGRVAKGALMKAVNPSPVYRKYRGKPDRVRKHSR